MGLLALPDALLVGTETGVARSADGGATWQTIPLSPAPDAVHTLLSDPRDERVVYAAGWLARFKSLDGGLSWTPLDDPAARSGRWVTAFALATSAPDTLYAFSLTHSLWRCDDGGASWGPELPAPDAAGLDSASMLVDPRDPETVLVGSDDGVWASRDGGRTFRRLRRNLPPLAPGHTAFPGAFDLALDGAQRILLATAQGLWVSTDAGRSWTAAALRGVHANAIRFLRFDPFLPRRSVFAHFETLMESRDGSHTTTPLSVPHPGYLQAIAFDPFERNRLVALTREGFGGTALARIFVSRDGGRTWGPPVTAPAGTSALAVPATRALLAMADSRIFLRTDDDATWRRRLLARPTDVDRGWFVFHSLVAHPSRPEVLFALGSDHVLHGGSVPVVYRSLDGGQRWSLWERGANTVAFDPGRPDFVFFTRLADIYRRRVDGERTQRIGGIEPPELLQALVVDRGDPQTFYVATYFQGLLVSHDGARTWNPAAQGLPLDGTVPVTTLVQDPLNPRRLYATPSTGGLWRLDLPPR